MAVYFTDRGSAKKKNAMQKRIALRWAIIKKEADPFVSGWDFGEWWIDRVLHKQKPPFERASMYWELRYIRDGYTRLVDE